jgi:hypothetical protein
MSEAQQDGDWVFSEIGRTYPTAEDYRRGITGGCTIQMQMMWVPRGTTYCFWLGKDGETRGAWATPQQVAA